jgi:hypothetical protein
MVRQAAKRSGRPIDKKTPTNCDKIQLGQGFAPIFALLSLKGQCERLVITGKRHCLA